MLQNFLSWHPQVVFAYEEDIILIRKKIILRGRVVWNIIMGKIQDVAGSVRVYRPAYANMLMHSSLREDEGWRVRKVIQIHWYLHRFFKNSGKDWNCIAVLKGVRIGTVLRLLEQPTVTLRLNSVRFRPITPSLIVLSPIGDFVCVLCDKQHRLRLRQRPTSLFKRNGQIELSAFS